MRDTFEANDCVLLLPNGDKTCAADVAIKLRLFLPLEVSRVPCQDPPALSLIHLPPSACVLGLEQRALGVQTARWRSWCAPTRTAAWCCCTRAALPKCSAPCATLSTALSRCGPFVLHFLDRQCMRNAVGCAQAVWPRIGYAPESLL